MSNDGSTWSRVAAELADHLLGRRLTPRVADTHPIDRASEAHTRLDTGGVRGRLVLTF